VPVHRFVFLHRPGVPAPATIYVDDWTIDVSVGIDEVQAAALTAYPNPVDAGTVRVAGIGMGQVRVFAADGRMVWSGASVAADLELPVMGWEAGVYHVVTASGRSTRFVVR
jgi:hypothetical protein